MSKKLSERALQEIKDHIKDGVAYSDLAQAYQVKMNVIMDIAEGKEV